MGKLLTRRSLIAGLTAGLAASFISVATVASAQGVAGSYRAEGRNPDGSAYKGSVQIFESKGVLLVKWQVGNQNYSGSGTRSGDVIWVNWGDTYPVVYIRMPSGELHGTWANGKALERLIP
ncbi:hypothetical protein [Pseudophaeobacter sp.]|uniref:LIC10280 family protein n=1 Tax=Pseudophaeobacter sp. TaxID=1971739 RepID=UPI003297AB2B